MPGRAFAPILLALLVGAPIGARPGQSAAPDGVISMCVAQAPATLKGLSALRAACPGIGRAIDGLGLGAFLPPHWQQALTPRALAALEALARGYRGSPLSGAPDPGALRAIASDLAPPAPPPSLWDQIKARALQWTAPLRKALGRWLRSVGRNTGSHELLAAFFVFAGLLLLTVIVVIILELRSAGLIGPRPRSGHRALARADAKTPPDETRSSDAIDWNELRDHPARLLRLLVDALYRSHRIERERHLTCREIIAEARFDSEAQRRDFSRIALLAERELFGPDAPPSVPQETLHAAETLRAELLAGPPRSAAAP